MSIFKKIFTNLTPPKVLMILACVLSSLCTTAYMTNVYTLRPIWLSPPPYIFRGFRCPENTIVPCRPEF